MSDMEGRHNIAFRTVPLCAQNIVRHTVFARTSGMFCNREQT